eukprot:TRINITY_DN5587_c0_g1_i1.p1 TRINITY_DN5587_c0_g1~~TRINITY_DN5587_c0_g1_i1.p1  ORF type:complete len:231 (+),score=49.22 TRINITY_DN5587_c0_g1_i1:23-694(+)
MLENGLLSEVSKFQTKVMNDVRLQNGHYEEDNFPKPDSGSGPMQAIGYKEFMPYFRACIKIDIPLLEPHTEIPEFNESIQALKSVTRKYAKKQQKWIRNKFIAGGLPMMKVDSSNVELWDEIIMVPATKVVKQFLDKDTPHPLSIPVNANMEALEVPVLGSEEDRFGNFECTTCNGRILVGRKQWEEHQKTKAHRRMLKRSRKRSRPVDACGTDDLSKHEEKR